jgi:hypothetical protein
VTEAQLELLKRVTERHGCDIAPLYYVDSDKGEPDLCANFCFEHAAIVARWSARETGVETWVARSWGETDHAHTECDFGGCAQLLRTDGGITSYGVDGALALTEEDPFKACVSPEELELAACAMMPDDERWATWEKQARRLLRTKPWRKR